MNEFFEEAALQDHPLRLLKDFLATETANEQAKKYKEMRFAGYVLEMGYDTVTMITSDPYKVNVGGVPRNSLLIMVPAVPVDGMPPHFTVLRVLQAAPTPLTKEVQQTYFELQKKSMPELDVFTQSELQWGALSTAVLGMFYPHPFVKNGIEFSGDLNNFVSAHHYRVYAPDDKLLALITNALVPSENRFRIGSLRLTECRLPLPSSSQPNVTVLVSTMDFMGTRTAMFGKTRLGKSNVIKLIAQSLIETTKASRNVGQVIFDINGEYANDNPQDDSSSLRSAYPDRCDVYALTPKPDTPSKPLKLNFYEHPERAHRVLADLLADEGRNSIYIRAFCSAAIPSLRELHDMEPGQKKRATRRILMYWAILHKAGYPASATLPLSVNPGLNAKLRDAIHSGSAPSAPNSLASLVSELERLQDFARANPGHQLLQSSSGSGRPLLESDETALLDFLKPPLGAGVKVIQPYKMYHDPQAGNFIQEIIDLVDDGRTVILDLGNANPEVMTYFSEELSSELFKHQVTKFTANQLGEHYVQLYFEEAHNLFPVEDKATIDIYRRLAKEGAKYHVGMVYATQSVTSINRDLLAQTENFFVAHMSSQEQVQALARVNFEFESMKDDIMRAKTPGYIRMLTKSHRFVVSMQADRFTLATEAENELVATAVPGTGS
ncbi:MAG: DUF87 domain-containing protein [candidate division NC10 bacterium]|nr:DUF87 domain-containing protein [candidate division NC10 bacterium]